MKNRNIIKDSYGMAVLERKDREKYNRLSKAAGPGDGLDWNSALGQIERCPWCCPVTCANCKIKNCADRLAGRE